MDRFREERKQNMYYPFSCEEDMEVALWLAGQELSINQIDKFLKLQYVRDHDRSYALDSAVLKSSCRFETALYRSLPRRN